MERKKSLFNKLIKCHCGSNLKLSKERKGKNAYICSSYANYRKCKRNLIPENLLLEFVQRFCDKKGIELILDNEFIKSIINEIILDNDINIAINYKNDYQQIISNNLIKF